MKGKKGFTLIELVIVLILIGIVAAIAVPKFIDLQTEAKKNAVKGALASVRSAINIYYAKNAFSGNPKYPSVARLRTLMNGPFPKNPFNNLSSINTTLTPGEVNSSYGWGYKAETGQFWSAVGGGVGAQTF